MHVDVHRQWIRDYMPGGSERHGNGGSWGFCFDDIDGLFRTYRSGKDACGPLTVVEIKRKGNRLSGSQNIALQRLDEIMRTGAGPFVEAKGFNHHVWNGVYHVEYLDLDPAPPCSECGGTGYHRGQTPTPERDSVRWWVNGQELDAEAFTQFLLSPHKHAEPKWRAA